MYNASMKVNRSAPGKWLFIFVFVTMAGSIVYAIFGMIHAPFSPVPGVAYTKLKSDYALMLLQCSAGIIVMFLPSMFERRLKIAIPSGMYSVYVVFLYCAVYLGEVRSFYYNVPNWDKVLHVFSGLMLGALSFSLISLLNKTQKAKITLSPAFVAIFAFSFAVAAGVAWEIYEFSVDSLFSLNMQKYALENGTPLLGHAALTDTMEDLIVDALGAIVMSLVGYISIKYKKGWVSKLILHRILPDRK
jgi:hypothetical protein